MITGDSTLSTEGEHEEELAPAGDSALLEAASGSQALGG